MGISLVFRASPPPLDIFFHTQILVRVLEEFFSIFQFLETVENLSNFSVVDAFFLILMTLLLCYL